MILVDTALQRREAEGRPIRVAFLGAGFMAQGLANQLTHSAPGMRLAGVFSRRGQRARDILSYSGRTDAVTVSSSGEAEDAMRGGKPIVTEDPFLLTRSDQVDVVVDLTGSVEFGARAALDAFRHQKDVVLMNAEIDATIGPIL